MWSAVLGGGVPVHQGVEPVCSCRGPSDRPLHLPPPRPTWVNVGPQHEQAVAMMATISSAAGPSLRP